MLPMRTNGDVCQAVKHQLALPVNMVNSHWIPVYILTMVSLSSFSLPAHLESWWFGLCFMWSWNYLTLKAPASIQHRKELFFLSSTFNPYPRLATPLYSTSYTKSFDCQTPIPFTKGDFREDGSQRQYFPSFTSK